MKIRHPMRLHQPVCLLGKVGHGNNRLCGNRGLWALIAGCGHIGLWGRLRPETCIQSATAAPVIFLRKHNNGLTWKPAP